MTTLSDYQQSIASVSASYSGIDLSKLDKPDLLKPIDIEDLIAEMVADLRARDANQYAEILESDPAVKLLETEAYRIKHEVDQINYKATQLTLAWAEGEMLDHLGMTYYGGTRRLVVQAADASASPPKALVMESDDSYRYRLSLYPESITTAGSSNAYIFHALSADGRVGDVSVTSPYPGTTLVSLIQTGAALPEVDFESPVWKSVISGAWGVDVTLNLAAFNPQSATVADDVLANVNAHLQPEDVRPQSEEVLVRAGTVGDYTLRVDLYMYVGVGRAQVMQASARALIAYVSNQFKLGRDINDSGIKAAAHGVGVQRAARVVPAADIVNDELHASRCRSIRLVFAGEAL